MARHPTKKTRGIANAKSINALYGLPLESTRTGALYTAFPYPTKISPEAIALFIATHTKPGDVVFDGFSGSGTTGLAAMLCERPTAAMRARAKELKLSVTWGARNAVLYEIGALGAFVAQTLTHPVDPQEFRASAEKILSDAEERIGWMYAAKGPDGREGQLRHLVWTDHLQCPHCKREASLWDGAVSFSPASISSDFSCPYCKATAPINDVQRVTTKEFDATIETNRTVRRRSPAFVYGKTARKTWSRPVQASDLRLLERIEREPTPSCVPKVAIPWGDLYRSGYHEGITHLHHLYTRRNLIAFGTLWMLTDQYSGTLREALRFWLLSYNASHSTIMTRVVAKQGQDDLVVTSAQPGVMYVSGLPVEKNIFAGVRRKLKTITDAFTTIYGLSGRVVVRQHSSCQLELLDNSIDYAFIDPPFGGNIPYAEVNFANEAWLGRYTNQAEEAVVSRHQGKSVQAYEKLMERSFRELHRVLKADAEATVVFHSASADIWNALRNAYKLAGYRVQHTSVLEKTQSSFKQVTTTGAVKGDPILLLRKGRASASGSPKKALRVAEQLHRNAGTAIDPAERTPQRLYSRFVTHFLAQDQQVPLDADAFYAWFAKHDRQASTELYA